MKKFEKVEKIGIISTKFSLRCTPSVTLGFKVMTKNANEAVTTRWGSSHILSLKCLCHRPSSMELVRKTELPNTLVCLALQDTNVQFQLGDHP